MDTTPALPPTSTAGWLVRRAGTGRRIAVGPVDITFELEAGDGVGFSVVHYEAAGGFVAPPVQHANTREDWAAYVIDGELGFVSGDESIRLGAGDFLMIPRGTPFAWENPGTVPARFLAIYQPGGFEQYFSEIGAVLTQRGGMPADPAELGQIVMPLWEKYGVQ